MDLKISQMPALDTINGTELLPAVTFNNENVNVVLNDIAKYANRLQWVNYIGYETDLTILNDKNAISFNSTEGGEITLNLLTDLNLDFEIGTSIILFARTDKVNIVVPPEMFVLKPSDRALSIPIGCIARLTKFYVDTWVLDGDLTKLSPDYAPIQRQRFFDFQMGVQKTWTSFIPTSKVFNSNLMVYVGGLLLNEVDDYLLAWTTENKPIVTIISYTNIQFSGVSIVDLVYHNNLTNYSDIPTIPNNLVLDELNQPVLIEDGTNMLLG